MDNLESIQLGHSIEFLIKFSFNCGMGPINFVGVVMQNMALVSQAQFFEGEVLEVVVDNHVVKLIGKLEGTIEASCSTLISGTR